jgi:hypothetical protein
MTERTGTVDHRTDRATVDGDGQVTVPIGPQGPGARPGEGRQQARVGMPVPVAGPDADQGDRRRDRRQEGGILVGRTVMGGLQYGRAQRTGVVGEQGLLRFGLGVPGQQDAGTSGGHRPRHQGIVVGVAARTTDAPHRPEDGDGQGTPLVAPARAGRHDRDTATAGGGQDGLARRHGIRVLRDRQRPHGPAT